VNDPLGDRAALVFAADLVPFIRAIRAQLHVGQPGHSALSAISVNASRGGNTVPPRKRPAQGGDHAQLTDDMLVSSMNKMTCAHVGEAAAWALDLTGDRLDLTFPEAVLRTRLDSLPGPWKAACAPVPS
jgi:hypothetical protein